MTTDGKLELQTMMAGWLELLLMFGAMRRLTAVGTDTTH